MSGDSRRVHHFGAGPVKAVVASALAKGRIENAESITIGCPRAGAYSRLKTDIATAATHTQSH
jgi:hypothetical protein